MAFRGLVDALDGVTACAQCGKATMLPLPVSGHRCWRCRHPQVHVPRPHAPHLRGHH